MRIVFFWIFVGCGGTLAVIGPNHHGHWLPLLCGTALIWLAISGLINALLMLRS